jgi:hypothetical protein
MSKLFKYFLLGAIFLLSSMSFEAASDKLAHLRTTKKILPVDNIYAPYYSIQILALRRAPQAPSFFRNVEQAREFNCADGYVRYTVGKYSSKEAALADISKVKSMGYPECFVVDLREYELNGGGAGSSRFDYNSDDVYTVQLAAFRYPVYTSHFEEFDEVMEFYPEDRIYRYTVGRYKGDEAAEALRYAKSKGYSQAHLVPIEKYLPYRIE